MHLVIGVIERDGGTLYCTALFFAPSGESLGKHRKLMPTAAERMIRGAGDGSTMPVLETPRVRRSLFLLSANQFARRSDYPEDYPIESDHRPDDVLCRGASLIVSPLGEILAGPETGGETILRAEVDLGRITEGKYDFDVVGHYARPDIFRLAVNEQPMPPVVADPHAGEPRGLADGDQGAQRRPPPARQGPH